MFAYISQEGLQAGADTLRALITSTDDAPVPYDEIHPLVCALK